MALKLGKEIYDLIYPIGTVYSTRSSSFNPNDTWYGTWEKIEDKFLLGASSTHTLGSTGGEETHKLTIDEIPSHNHSYSHMIYVGQNLWGAPNYQYTWDTNQVVSATTGNTGGGGAHNNMPPYIAVYFWERKS